MKICPRWQQAVAVLSAICLCGRYGGAAFASAAVAEIGACLLKVPKWMATSGCHSRSFFHHYLVCLVSPPCVVFHVLGDHQDLALAAFPGRFGWLRYRAVICHPLPWLNPENIDLADSTPGGSPLHSWVQTSLDPNAVPDSGSSFFATSAPFAVKS
jgi:hypothetical protein